jgi:PAS domain S-box-containing protein
MQYATLSYKEQVFFNLMPDPTAIVDAKGEILAVNDRAEEIFGFKREELVGKNFLGIEIMPMTSQEIAMKNLTKHIMGVQVAPYEIEMVRKDGRKLWAEVTTRMIEYEGKPAVLTIFRNITERKRMEEELKQHIETIKSLNAAITARLLQKVKQMENLSEIREKIRRTSGISSGLDLIIDTVLRDFDMYARAVLLIDRGDKALKARGFKSSKEGIELNESYSLQGGFAELEAVKQSRKISIE